MDREGGTFSHGVNYLYQDPFDVLVRGYSTVRLCLSLAVRRWKN